MSDETTIKLEVTRVRTRKPTGWGVAVGKTLDNNESVTIVGNGISMLSQGDRIECTGSWAHHDQYGKQFKLSKITDLEDPVNQHLIYWLRSFRGIGPAKAAMLESDFRAVGYDAFFKKTMSILGSYRTPDKTAIEWLAWLEPVLERVVIRSKAFGMKGLSSFLSLFRYLRKKAGYQISAKDVRDRVNDLWLSDPYDVLCSHYTFKDADTYILKNDVLKPDAPIRLNYVLNEILLGEPDTVVDVNKAHARANNEYAVPVWDMLLSGELSRMPSVRIIEHSTGTFLQNEMLHNCELDIKNSIEALAKRERVALPLDLNKLAEKLPFKLTEEQRHAVSELVNEPVGVLTGGAGTGKTTIMRALLRAYEISGNPLAFRLAAPTNKAARRLSRQTGVPATSIHKLLQATPTLADRAQQKRTGLSFDFQINELNQIHSSLIIIDEVSMVDTRLMAALLRGIDTATCRLLLVGDHQQLPPVQEGQPFVDIMEQNSLPKLSTYKLERIMRQNPGQLLSNSSAIRARRAEQVRMTSAPDWEFIRADDDDTIKRAIIAYGRKIYRESGHDPFCFQIITPRRHAHALSTVELNKLFRTEEFNTPNYAFVAGDKGLCTGHNALGLVNGDIFRVDSVDSVSNEMTITFETAEGLQSKKIDRETASLTQGWAITIHKFQGDEAPYILIPVSKTFGTFVTRSMMYTAITRAQKKVILIGDYDAFMDALQNEEPDRMTGFKLGAFDDVARQEVEDIADTDAPAF